MAHLNGVRSDPPCVVTTYLWLAENEGISKNMETTLMGYIGLGFRNGTWKLLYYLRRDIFPKAPNSPT